MKKLNQILSLNEEEELEVAMPTTEIESSDPSDVKNSMRVSVDMSMEMLQDIYHTLLYGEDSEQNMGKDDMLVDGLRDLKEAIEEVYDHVSNAYGIVPYEDPDLRIEIPEDIDLDLDHDDREDLSEGTDYAYKIPKGNFRKALSANPNLRLITKDTQAKKGEYVIVPAIVHDGRRRVNTIRYGKIDQKTERHYTGGKLFVSFGPSPFNLRMTIEDLIDHLGTCLILPAGKQPRKDGAWTKMNQDIEIAFWGKANPR
jgi:hypothetical protein